MKLILGVKFISTIRVPMQTAHCIAAIAIPIEDTTITLCFLVSPLIAYPFMNGSSMPFSLPTPNSFFKKKEHQEQTSKKREKVRWILYYTKRFLHSWIFLSFFLYLISDMLFLCITHISFFSFFFFPCETCDQCRLSPSSWTHLVHSKKRKKCVDFFLKKIKNHNQSTQ